MMELETSQVQRNLDAKIKVLGQDAPDLLFVLILAAVMNLFFGDTFLAIPLILGLPTLLLIALSVGKKNRPEGFWVHFLRYVLSPGKFNAGEEPKNEQKMTEAVFEQYGR